MKDEIKEIKIKTIGQLLDFVETEEKAKELIDYITNLQEESEKNKEYSEFYKDMSDKWKDMSDVFKKSCEDYKSKIDKAVEFIAKEFLCYDNESDEYIQGKKAINILKGEDKEDE